MAKANTAYKYGRFLGFHPHGASNRPSGRFAS